MKQPHTVDCLVVGAGPVGSVAAERLARYGHDVLMIEKRSEIGVPVRCGEGISKNLLQLLDIHPDPKWVAREMDGAIVVSPSGKELIVGPEIAGPEVGFVIRRDMFDRELAKKAANSGSDIWVMTEARSFKKENGRAHVNCRTLNGSSTIKAKVVIAADGFESGVARMAGMNPSLDQKNIDTCIQYQMQGVKVRGQYTEFFLGRDIAPGGYVWCFPKGPDTANVGIGVNLSMIRGKARPKWYLDNFIKNNERFNKGKIIEVNGGGVSVGLPMEKTHDDNLIVVGDAARMIDPLTGGGIYNGCSAAIEAARAVHESIEEDRYDAGFLRRYEKYWRDRIEGDLVRNYIAKEKFLRVDDSTIDKIVGAISEYDMIEVSTAELLNALRSKYPEIVEDIFGT